MKVIIQGRPAVSVNNGMLTMGIPVSKVKENIEYYYVYMCAILA